MAQRHDATCMHHSEGGPCQVVHPFQTIQNPYVIKMSPGSGWGRTRTSGAVDLHATTAPRPTCRPKKPKIKNLINSTCLTGPTSYGKPFHIVYINMTYHLSLLCVLVRSTRTSPWERAPSHASNIVLVALRGVLLGYMRDCHLVEELCHYIIAGGVSPQGGARFTPLRGVGLTATPALVTSLSLRVCPQRPGRTLMRTLMRFSIATYPQETASTCPNERPKT